MRFNMDFENSYTPYLSEEKLKYLRLLSEKYPTIPAVCREIINLKAILNLPKGTEHFMSDLHGEYEAFYHILNNAAGVIKEKVDMIFADPPYFLSKNISTCINGTWKSFEKGEWDRVTTQDNINAFNISRKVKCFRYCNAIWFKCNTGVNLFTFKTRYFFRFS